jgi:hypothetical protein
MIGSLSRGNPKTSLTPPERVKAREAIKWLREHHFTITAVAAAIGSDVTLVHTWYFSACNPGKRYFTPLLRFYEEQLHLYQQSLDDLQKSF